MSRLSFRSVFASALAHKCVSRLPCTSTPSFQPTKVAFASGLGILSPTRRLYTALVKGYSARGPGPDHCSGGPLPWPAKQVRFRGANSEWIPSGITFLKGLRSEHARRGRRNHAARSAKALWSGKIRLYSLPDLDGHTVAVRLARLSSSHREALPLGPRPCDSANVQRCELRCRSAIHPTGPLQLRNHFLRARLASRRRVLLPTSDAGYNPYRVMFTRRFPQAGTPKLTKFVRASLRGMAGTSETTPRVCQSRYL